MEKIKRILIAVDEASTSEKVVLFGYNVAKQLNAEVALVSAVDTEFIITEGDVTQDELAEMQEENLRQSHQLLIYKIFNKQEITTFIRRGEPHEIITKTAEEWNADLIVLGTHGRTGFSHLLIGSVAEEVIRLMAKPTLIVPLSHD